MIHFRKLIFVLSTLLLSNDALLSQNVNNFKYQTELNKYEIQFSLSQRYHQPASVHQTRGNLKFKSLMFFDRSFSLQFSKRYPEKTGWQIGLNAQAIPYLIKISYPSYDPEFDLFDLGVHYVSLYAGANHTFRFQKHFELICSSNGGFSVGNNNSSLIGSIENSTLLFVGHQKSQKFNFYVDGNVLFRKMFPFYSVGISAGLQYFFFNPTIDTYTWVHEVDSNFVVKTGKFSVPFSIVISRNLCSKHAPLYTQDGYWD